MSSSGGPIVAIQVTSSGVGATNSQVASVGANWDKVGLQGFAAARSITNGISGLISAEQGVYQAQQRVNTANINYILTVREYGQGSLQAQKALISLNQAQESVSLAQTQLNLQWVRFAITVGPQVYAAITKMIAASQGMTVANWQETASWERKAAAIGATAVALSLATFGASALLGGIGASAVTANINQTNNFSGASGSTTSLVNLTNSSISKSVSSAVSP